MRFVGAALLIAVVVVAAPASSSTIVVTSGADVVDGDTSSPAALAANPGADGISLREALAAANRAGHHTVTFADSLRGSTIPIRGAMYVTAEGIAILGLRGTDGEPDITLSGAQFDERFHHPHRHEPDLLTILASRFRLEHLRFREVKHRAVVVQAGPLHGGAATGPQVIRDIRIADNVFDTTGFISGDPYVDAIRVWTDVLGGAASASIAGVAILRNRMSGFNGNGVIVSASGDACTIERVVIASNEISNTAFPIEVNAGNGAGIHVADVRILSNAVSGTQDLPGIFVGHVPATGTKPNSSEPWPPGAGNRIEDVVISRNRMRSHMQIDAGTSANGRDNVVRDVLISGNAVFAESGLWLLGGNPASTGNRVDGVRIVSNTVVATRITSFGAIEHPPHNAIENVVVSSSIFIGESGPGMNTLRAGTVRDTITNTPALAGDNGNRDVDPMFVDPVAGDLRLRPGSPAIDAAAADAPASDIDCRARAGAPDLGAHEFGAAARWKLTAEAVGNGAIVVTPEGLECGPSWSFAPGATVALQPQAHAGWRFASWLADEDCRDATVGMDRDRICVALFDDVRRRRSVRH
ncbi:MAG TPA: hypothetical protein VFO89_16320 [Thermoanaerobaculia bacterium]|nr:hypothetical protein [Thermoanaerobaculia bacterium]